MCCSMLRKLRFYVQKEPSLSLFLNTNVRTNNIRRYNEQMDHIEKINKVVSSVIPDEPTTCCMSGCANCVWIQYAEELAKVLQDGQKTQEIIMKKVTDPNMRAFLMTELKAMKKMEQNI